MNKYIIVITVIFSIVGFSCGTGKRLSTLDLQDHELPNDTLTPCSNLDTYVSLYVSGITAKLDLNDNKYDARVSMFYLPDSVLLISAVNTGFELVRIKVMKDSTVYVNRHDRLVYVLKTESKGYLPPINFTDIEMLINMSMRCDAYEDVLIEKDRFVYDRSVKDIAKKIWVDKENLSVNGFEFFQKKTGEYLVGKRIEDESYKVYANFIVDDLSVLLDKGKVEFNREIPLDLGVNTDKYSIIYL